MPSIDTLRIPLLVLSIAFPALLTPPPAAAVPPAEERHLELFAGRYASDLSGVEFDNPFSFGARGGYRWERFGLEATISRFESDFEVGSTTGDHETTALELSASVVLNPWDRFEWSLFAGPGYVSVDTTNRFPQPGQPPIVASSGSDGLSVHGGVAVRIGFGERLYLRPDVRIRLYDGPGGSTLGDFELSAALGYSFF